MVATDAATSPRAVPAGRRLRLDALTGLRWVAAFGVFAFHVSELYPLPGGRAVTLFGNSGVTFFFVLSGFVLTWSFRRRDTARRFWWRRLVRIWPALAVSTVLAVPVFYAGRGLPFGPAEWGGVLASLTLVQAWIPAVLFAGNPAAWSLSDEAFFYLLFPAVVRPLLGLRLRWLALLAVGLVSFSIALRWVTTGAGLTRTQETLLFVSPPGRLGEFLLGMVVASAMRRGWRCPVPVTVAGALAVTGVTALWAVHVHPPAAIAPVVLHGRPVSWPELLMNQVTAPLYALLIASAASRDVAHRWSVLRSRPLVVLGRWSYAFYLVHATVLHWYAQHVVPARPAGWDNWRPSAVVLGLGLLAAVALFALVERPAEAFARSRGPGRARPVPVRTADADADTDADAPSPPESTTEARTGAQGSRAAG